MDEKKCYSCKWRRSVPGDAHSKCGHPDAGTGDDPLAELMSIFASVGRIGPTIDVDSAINMGIKAKEHGIINGWFNWPYNFDPAWLTNCNGWETKE